MGQGVPTRSVEPVVKRQRRASVVAKPTTGTTCLCCSARVSSRFVSSWPFTVSRSNGLVTARLMSGRPARSIKSPRGNTQNQWCRRRSAGLCSLRTRSATAELRMLPSTDCRLDRLGRRWCCTVGRQELRQRNRQKAQTATEKMIFHASPVSWFWPFVRRSPYAEYRSAAVEQVRSTSITRDSTLLVVKVFDAGIDPSAMIAVLPVVALQPAASGAAAVANAVFAAAFIWSMLAMLAKLWIFAQTGEHRSLLSDRARPDGIARVTAYRNRSTPTAQDIFVHRRSRRRYQPASPWWMQSKRGCWCERRTSCRKQTCCRRGAGFTVIAKMTFAAVCRHPGEQIGNVSAGLQPATARLDDQWLGLTAQPAS